MTKLPKLGIDMGTASLKVVELVPSTRGRWKLNAAGSMPVSGAGISTSPSNQSALIAGIVKLVKESGARSKKVVLSLPEEQVSSHVVDMPLLSDSEVEQALQWQVEQYIPIPADQAIWSYQIIKKDEVGGGMQILLAAAAKTLIDAYRNVLDQAGLEVIAIETELMATARSVVPEGSPLAVIVDIGAKSTDIGVVSGGQLVFTRTVPTAGEAFTRAIESTLGLDTKAAEQYRNTYGFSSESMGGKVLTAMKPVLDIIASEIKKTIDFYVSKNPGEVVKLVVLSGGVAALPDVVGLLSSALGIEVGVGDAFGKVDMDDKQKKSLSGNGPFYAVALGLAMRET